MSPLETRVLLSVCRLAERLVTWALGFAERHEADSAAVRFLRDGRWHLLWVQLSLAIDIQAMRDRRAEEAQA